MKTTHGYNDVAVHNNLVYAVRCKAPYTVDVIESKSWLRLRKMSSPCCPEESYSPHTLHVSDDRILLCCYTEDKLQVLSHSGELLQNHGRSRREATEDDITGKTATGDPVYDHGVLSGPYLCQVDDEGSAFVVDCVNDRLQVMRAD